jgi:hypothetical protein
MKIAKLKRLTSTNGLPMPFPLFALRSGVFAVALAASAASHAALIGYSSRAAFDAATTLQFTEPNVAPENGFYQLSNLNYNGFLYPDYAYMVDPGYTPSLYQWGSGPVLLLARDSRLGFAPITAFGADFGTLPDGFTLTVTIDGIATMIPTPRQRQLTFYGFTSDTPFSTVAFSTNAQYLILDNATRATALANTPPDSQVPEPAPLAMLGLAMAAIAARRRA